MESAGGILEDSSMTHVEGSCLVQISGCHGPNAVYCFPVVKAAASNSAVGRSIFSCLWVALVFHCCHWVFPDVWL